MKLYQYTGRAQNFGDEINSFLFPKILNVEFKENSSAIFLGAGSILFDYFPSGIQKIVFGSGYGGYTSAPVIDDTWHIHFVRGPLTAQILGLDPAVGIGDSAALLANLGYVRQVVPGRIGFMPHVDSACDGAWPEVAAQAGLYYIDPRWPVPEVIAAMLSVETLVSEAMHGAIVADALRIPWVAMLPNDPRHRPKWDDWAASLGITLKHQPLAPSSLLEALLNASHGRRGVQRYLRWYMRNVTKLGARLFRPAAVSALRRAMSAEPQLSTDAAHAKALSAMNAALDKLRRDPHMSS